MAVRAPRSADRNDHDLALKLRVRVRDDLPRKIREAERKRSRGILHPGLLCRSGWSSKVLLASLRRTPRYQVDRLRLLCLRSQQVRDQHCAVPLRRQRVQSCPGSGEAANLVGRAVPAAIKRAGVAVDTLDDSMNTIRLARGLHTQEPRCLSL